MIIITIYVQYTKATNGICKWTIMLPSTKAGSIYKKVPSSLYIVLT